MEELQDEGLCKRSCFKVIPLYCKTKPQLEEKKFSHKFIILFIGTLDDNKGIDILINSFNEIKSDFFELHIGGSGELKEYVEKVANENQNIYYHGYLYNTTKD